MIYALVELLAAPVWLAVLLVPVLIGVVFSNGKGKGKK